ncbi:MAG TPA: 2-oxoglutarate dehydrogenase, E2 component, dihydrolipoamide succinyltransferase [Actinomycetota bacterium]|jgi:2-oxoglutarate dehydrogenase E2 component (dihydrolipoamide succinyltransferase)|nr:2-oxoglutarate dehydrogenase, E2 component, dihydrolipoamide succinyltransferase [Actinomycetota bacterium]
MATPVKMPELGESITEGTITRWIKQEGDRVEADEPLFEVSTDKVDTEVPSPVAGVLKAIKVQADETVEVGAELAIIEQDGESGGEEQAEASEGEAEDQGEAAESEASEGEEQAEEAAEPGAGSEEAGGEEEREETAAEETSEQPKAEASGDGQTTTVTMPELGESITEGTITRWLKQEGDQVEADEPLFEISTDKVDTEVPSPVSGVLQSIKVQADETVEVGAELAVIGGGGGAAKAPAAGEDTADKEVAKEETAEEGAGAEAEQAAEEPPAAEEKPEEKPKEDKAAARSGNGKAAAGVSPLVRRLAREHDVDLSQVQGSGSGGRVRREDVEAYVQQRGQEPAAAKAPAAGEAKGKAAAAPSAPPRVAVPLTKGLREEVVPATRLRKVIAERMVASLQTSAQLTSAVEIDMTKVMRLRERAKDEFKEREGVSLSPMPFAVLALITAIHEYPNVNSAMDEEGNLHVYKDVHLGVAVDTPKGLFVPVVKNAGSLNLAGLAKAIADVAKRTRDGKIAPDELSGSTISLTNTGSRGAVWDTPIINQPNAAIFATPAIVKRPVVVDDPELGEVVAVRQMMYGILTYDHRIIDGADAARFLVKVKEVLEAADFEGDLGLERE